MHRIFIPPPIPERPKLGHKGLFGRVLIVGGNEQMLGAPVMAGTAALRLGAGLVQIAIPSVILPAALSVTPELIGLALGNTATPTELDEAAGKADAIVIGPGLGQSKAAWDRLMKLITLEKPIVVDADGLNMLAEGKGWPKTFAAKAVLTPHPGEMRRLAKLIGTDEVPPNDVAPNDMPADDDGRIALAVKAAVAFKQVIVLKGDGTVVTDSDRVYLNPHRRQLAFKSGQRRCAQRNDRDVARSANGPLRGGMCSGSSARTSRRDRR